MFFCEAGLISPFLELKSWDIIYETKVRCLSEGKRRRRIDFATRGITPWVVSSLTVYVLALYILDLELKIQTA